jgi:hypothetical protein
MKIKAGGLGGLFFYRKQTHHTNRYKVNISQNQFTYSLKTLEDDQMFHVIFRI